MLYATRGAHRGGISRRLSAALTISVIAILAGSSFAVAKPPTGDPGRVGPPDGPRGKSQRTPAVNDLGSPPDFWAESGRIENPNKGDIIPGNYIIVFKPGTPGVGNLANQLADETGGSLNYVYEHALPGFAAGGLTAEDVEKLSRHPNVQSIEPDRVAGPEDTQLGATWGIDRIDQRDLPLNGSYTDGNEGVGVHVYVIDTGIRLTHSEFTGRVGNGYDAVTPGGNGNDCNGHGTHVAGTIGGTSYGVADKVTLHPVRVLDCNGSGTNSGVIAGVDWVRVNRIFPAVANMSLGGGASSALDTAVTNAINAGVTFSLAAGNENQNACNVSPARTPAGITVGATTNTDARASFSNWGTCLDLFAPGQNITSAWITNDTATNTISGTSMAAPHVAGMAAIYLAAYPISTPAAVRNALVNTGTTGKVTSPGTGSPNVLLFSTTTASATPPPPPPPPPPPVGANVLPNPGFESGTQYWTQYSSGGYNLVDSYRPRSGLLGVFFGGYNSANESIGQNVTVPANGTLTYYWHMTSTEGTTTAYDYMYVRVYSTSGTLLATLRAWSNRNTRNVWSLDTLSLAAWAGQTIRLQFAASTDSSLQSSFYIDDLAVR